MATSNSPICGQVKFPQGDDRTVGLLRGWSPLGKTVGGFFEAITPATELDEYAAVHEAVENGGGQRGIAKELVPVIDDAV